MQTMPGSRQPGLQTIGGSAAMPALMQRKAQEILGVMAKEQKDIEGLELPQNEKDARSAAVERRALMALQAVLGRFERFFPAERVDPNADLPPGPPIAGGGR
jgi:hypothetical protein